ncbi:hypothetical protein [Scytonema sp. NUACC26]|uniref:hypothetical protein n=1 Tax=Scytonema sp. NUACC26 TaxID=3140176 RepID=UPI0038B3D204
MTIAMVLGWSAIAHSQPVKQDVVKRSEAETSTTIHTIEPSERKTDADTTAHQRSPVFLSHPQR